jgi:hypothetical protein
MKSNLGKSWGPSAWYIFHVMSLTWTENNINSYIRFFNLIQKTIPCYICSQNFKKKINSSNLSINKNCKNRDDMIQWIITLHNLVNKSNNKKTYNVTEVEDIYIKDKTLNLNCGHYIKFINEYIIYNIKHGNKNDSIRILYILGVLFPEKNKQKRFVNLIKKSKKLNVFTFINNYVKILKT